VVDPGWTTELLADIAAYSAAGNVGTWNPQGIYTAGQIGIFLVAVPASPDQIITLDEYGTTDADGTGDVTVLLQARFRGLANKPTTAKDLRDAFRDRFNGLEHVDFGGTHITQMFATPGAPLGFDQNNRLELTANFTLQARHQTALRTD
jgi:hypothetical protein